MITAFAAAVDVPVEIWEWVATYNLMDLVDGLRLPVASWRRDAVAAELWQHRKIETTIEHDSGNDELDDAGMAPDRIDSPPGVEHYGRKEHRAPTSGRRSRELSSRSSRSHCRRGQAGLLVGDGLIAASPPPRERPNRRYIDGTTSRFSSVEVRSPPRMTTAMGCSIS